MRRAHGIRDVSRSLADQLQVAQGGIIMQFAGNEPRLVETIGIGDDLLGKTDHVVQVKQPGARGGLRYAQPPVR